MITLSFRGATSKDREASGRDALANVELIVAAKELAV
jgi:hypothetical protein